MKNYPKELAKGESDIEKIGLLNDELNSIFNQAIKEIEKEEQHYM